jgi:hypothetical protein
MPTDAEHRDKYQDNVSVLNAHGGLSGTSECWAAVVAFYAALHLVERLAAQTNTHHARHRGRGSRLLYLSGHPRHNQILADYMALQTASEIARYESLGAFRAAYLAGATQAQLINGCLNHIEQYVAQALAPPAAGPGPAPGSGS